LAPTSLQDQAKVKATTTEAITLVTTVEVAVSPSLTVATTEAEEEAEEAEATDLVVEEVVEVEEAEVVTIDHWMIGRKVMVVRECSIRGIVLHGANERVKDERYRSSSDYGVRESAGRSMG
jgi:hypothetical protein